MYLLQPFWVLGEVSSKLVLHELHIHGAPKSIALAETNAGLALMPPVRPGHMCVLCQQGRCTFL